MQTSSISVVQLNFTYFSTIFTLHGSMHPDLFIEKKKTFQFFWSILRKMSLQQQQKTTCILSLSMGRFGGFTSSRFSGCISVKAECKQFAERSSSFHPNVTNILMCLSEVPVYTNAHAIGNKHAKTGSHV